MECGFTIAGAMEAGIVTETGTNPEVATENPLAQEILMLAQLPVEGGGIGTLSRESGKTEVVGRLEADHLGLQLQSTGPCQDNLRNVRRDQKDHNLRERKIHPLLALKCLADHHEEEAEALICEEGMDGDLIVSEED